MCYIIIYAHFCRCWYNLVGQTGVNSRVSSCLNTMDVTMVTRSGVSSAFKRIVLCSMTNVRWENSSVCNFIVIMYIS